MAQSENTENILILFIQIYNEPGKVIISGKNLTAERISLILSLKYTLKYDPVTSSVLQCSRPHWDGFTYW